MKLTMFLATVTLILLLPVTANAGPRERKVQVMEALIKVWPKRYRAAALQVIGCETGDTFDPHVVGGGGLYYGLFQQGGWQRSTFGFGWTIIEQVRSGWRAFKANGYCWTCQNQWPVCGRGLD